MTKRTLYTAAQEAGLVIGNHYSDLYLRDTPEARALIAELCTLKPVPFVDQTTGERALDVPFHFDPYWEQKAKTSVLPMEWDRGNYLGQ